MRVPGPPRANESVPRAFVCVHRLVVDRRARATSLSTTGSPESPNCATKCLTHAEKARAVEVLLVDQRRRSDRRRAAPRPCAPSRRTRPRLVSKRTTKLSGTAATAVPVYALQPPEMRRREAGSRSHEGDRTARRRHAAAIICSPAETTSMARASARCRSAAGTRGERVGYPLALVRVDARQQADEVRGLDQRSLALDRLRLRPADELLSVETRPSQRRAPPSRRRGDTSSCALSPILSEHRATPPSASSRRAFAVESTCGREPARSSRYITEHSRPRSVRGTCRRRPAPRHRRAPRAAARRLGGASDFGRTRPATSRSIAATRSRAVQCDDSRIDR